MNMSPAIFVGLALICISVVQADNSTVDSQNRSRAAQLVNEISDPEQRALALALLNQERPNQERPSLEAALALIGQSQSTSTRIHLLRKLARSSKYKSIFTRSLTDGEIRQLHEAIGPVVDGDEQSGAALLAMFHMQAGLDRIRVNQSVKLLENVPGGTWKDTVCFSAIYVLTVRRHPATELRGARLPLEAKFVPEYFLTDAAEILREIEDARLREFARGLIALSGLHRRNVDAALKHADAIQDPVLRDTLHFQAVSVLLNNKVDRERTISADLSADEVARLKIALKAETKGTQ